MEISETHFLIMMLTVVTVICFGLYFARSIKSAEGYSLGGRSASVWLVAGSIAGTCVGGGATVGTAQLAAVTGLSAWWFTLGVGISLIIMAFFYAKPLRRTSLETIPQYLALNYGWITTENTYNTSSGIVGTNMPNYAEIAVNDAEGNPMVNEDGSAVVVPEYKHKFSQAVVQAVLNVNF